MRFINVALGASKRLLSLIGTDPWCCAVVAFAAPPRVHAVALGDLDLTRGDLERALLPSCASISQAYQSVD